MDSTSFFDNFASFFRMQYTFSFIIELMMASLGALLSVGGWRKRLKTKEYIIATIEFICLFAIETLLCALSNSFSSSINAATPYLVVASIILPGTVYVLLRDCGNIRQKVIKTLLFLSSVYAVSEIGHHVSVFTTAFTSIEFGSFAQLFISALPNLLMGISGFLCGFFDIDEHKNIPTVYLVLSTLIFISIFSVTIWQGTISYSTASYHWMICFTLMLFLTIDMATYVVIYLNVKKQEQLIRSETKAKMNASASLMLELNEKSIQSTTKLRHDLKNHFAYVISLLNDEKNDEAMKYLENVTEQELEKYHVIDCGNQVVSSIMNLEYAKAQMKEVDLRYILAVSKHLPLNDYELCSLLTNVIDNAIDGAELVENDKFVDVHIKEENGILRILVKNPTTKKNTSNISSKSEPGHGYGKYIIDEIVKKHNGYCRHKIEDGEYICDLFLNLEEKKDA